MLLFLSLPVQAETITLPSEQEISLETFGEPSSEYDVLWIHSERGVTEPLEGTLKNITEEQSIRIYFPDFHDSYFITPSSSSLEKVPQTDIEDLIKFVLNGKASNKDMSKNLGKNRAETKKLFIVASSRAAGIVLNAVHHLQSQKINTIAGIIMIAPYLQEQVPEIGKAATYQKIAAYSNLPLYIFQAERSPRIFPLPRVVKELEKGGSDVFVHVLKGIQGGFHMRKQSDLAEMDIKGLQKLPEQMFNALSLLGKLETAELKPLASYEKNIRKKPSNKLQKVTFSTPTLSLNDLNGKTKKLSDYEGKVVIASFWASWCRPCLDEIPSLVKLKQQYQDQLEILAVNIGEDKKTIEHFTKGMNINFPILQDKESGSVKDWKVYVYPSNFILDTSGNIQYAATGAMDWQEDSINRVIQKLSAIKLAQ